MTRSLSAYNTNAPSVPGYETGLNIDARRSLLKMAMDRLLTTVLRLYQDVHDAQQTDRILGSTATLLANLSNPLNLTVLTSQFLTAPAIWQQPSGLHTCARAISIFNTAAVHVRRNELENAWRRGPPAGGGLGAEAWARAVINGADGRSARWQHLLVLTGVLVGLEGNGGQSLPSSVRSTLEHGVVAATNLALEAEAPDSPLAAPSVVLGLNYAFPLLSDSAKSMANLDVLLPAATRAMAGDDGFQDGTVLLSINAESRVSNKQLHWPPTSRSFASLQAVDSRPLVAGAGPLSRMLVYAVGRARDPRAVLEAQNALLAFTEALARHWSISSHLSGFDISMEAAFLSAETAQHTWPRLWDLLKKILYATTAVLQAIVSRSLLDAHLSADGVAPSIATKSLQTLRNLYFISSRQGATFQAYMFTYLASVDVLTRYPEAAVAFLRGLLSPRNSAHVPLDDAPRATGDLFYLNLAEHFATALPAPECDTLIVQPAMPYVSRAGWQASVPVSPKMLELFEAAHSAVLSVLSCPHNAPIAAGLAPLYAQALFSSFPSRISPRQFRLAFKTTMQVLSPPFPTSATHPQLAETLLEMVRMRIPTAGTAPLPPGPEHEAAQPPPGKALGPVSEQSTLVLAMIDALPFLALDVVEEWMTTAADAVWDIGDAAMREVAKARFWELMAGGEMDVERAAVGVAWWGTKGGGGLVLHGRSASSHHPYLMSGALLDGPGPSRL